MEAADLETHRSTFTRPISATYRGFTVYEIPPPTQVALLSLYVSFFAMQHAFVVCLSVTVMKVLCGGDIYLVMITLTSAGHCCPDSDEQP